MKMTKTTGYAIHALQLLAKRKGKEPVSCPQLAYEGQMPERFLLVVLRQLVENGLLRSSPGSSGGYTLARPASRIRLVEVMDAFSEAKPEYIPPMSGMNKRSCSWLKRQLRSADNARRDVLSEVSLKDLVEALPRSGPKTANIHGRRKP